MKGDIMIETENYLLNVFNDPSIPHKFHLKRNGLWVQEITETTTCESNLVEVQSVLSDRVITIRNRLHDLSQIINDLRESDEKNAWRYHTTNMHFAKEIQNEAKRKIDPNISQAYMKMMEILHFMPELVNTHNENGIYRSFHLCESPGQFLEALDNYIDKYHKQLNWEWKANSLNPYYEGAKAFDLFLEDRLIYPNMHKWCFGKSGRGDIFEWDTNCNSDNKYDLVTADGSFYTRDNPNMQEDAVFELFKKEYDIALTLLNSGGCFIIKIYSTYLQKTLDFIRDIADHFMEAVIFKPLSSNPRSNERYLVCRGYSIPQKSHENIVNIIILESELYFSQLRLHAVRYCLDHFGLTAKQIKQTCASLRQRTIDKVRRNINFDVICQLKKKSCLGIPTTQPWTVMFGNNYIERLKALGSRLAVKDWMTKILMNWDEKPREQLKDCHLWADLITDNVISHFSEQKYCMTYEKRPETVTHSLFLDPEWLHCLRKLEEWFEGEVLTADFGESFPPPITFLNFPPESFIFDLATFTRPADYYNCFRRIFKESEIGEVIFTCSKPKILLFLSRHSVSLFSLFCCFFAEVSFGEGEAIARFNNWRRPNFSSKTEQWINHLETFHENITCFVPMSILKILHPYITAYNTRQLLRILPQYCQRLENET